MSEEDANGQEILGLTKQDIRRLKKDLRSGAISKDQFDDAMGVVKEVVKTEDEKLAELKGQEYKSGVQSYKEKKGELTNNSRDIKIEEVSLAYQKKPLLEDTTVIINHGRKYGLIGPNGSGKSTLLRHISQRHIPIPLHINILHVEQEIEGTDQTALSAVIEADVERKTLLAEEEKLKPISAENTEEGLAANDRLVEIWSRLRAIGAHTAEARAAGILAGLQFTPVMQKKKTKEFSGGWRMRIALARALFVQPTLLLLDEPTNHLDLDASIWLETYLRKYKKTLLLVSHDRDFLNNIVTDIIDLRSKKLNYYKGDYDNYERLQKENERLMDKQRKIQQKEAAAVQKAQTQAAKTKHAKTQKVDEKKGKLVVTEKEKDYNVQFIFRDPPKLKIPVIQVKDVSFHYPGQENLFEHVELNLDCDSKIAIVGPNGAGKSTLVNLIIGELKPTEGDVYINPQLRYSKFSQHFVDQLTMSETAVEYIGNKFKELRPQEVRNKLGMFGLKGVSHTQPISLLSGGQKSRVCICEMSLSLPHIMFLDEPTNHLDIQSVDALAEALIGFGGGVIFITHDQRLVNRVAKELWVCKPDERSVTRYDGTFDDYKQEIIEGMPDEWFLEDES
jgi:ATPase subunit of ABC transporter with duplicated ATPase domains